MKIFGISNEELIKFRKNLGLPLDNSIFFDFEKKIKHKNYIFSNGIDLIQEFFNFERKFDNTILSKSVKLLGRNISIKKIKRVFQNMDGS